VTPLRRLILASTFLLVLPAVPLWAQDSSSPPPSRFHFGVFGDIDLLHSSSPPRDLLDGGELDLYSTAQISDKWSALGEVLIQHVRANEQLDARLTKHTEFDVERLYIAYRPSDVFRVEAGQIHTGLVRWNEREHQGRFLQTSIDTPAIARREEQGGAWPLHFIGLWASGRVRGPLGITYGVGLGQGRGQIRDEIQPLTDPASSPSTIVTIGIAPDMVAGLELGAGGYRGTTPSHEGTLHEFDWTLSGSYVSGRLELRTEWGRMNHTLRGTGQRFVTDGWYALASYRLRGKLRTLRPYALVDHLVLPEGEQYLADVRGLRAWSGGVRWDVSRHVALKFDFRLQRVADAAQQRLLRMQLAFSF
jgi:hypothetical protein